MPRKKKEKKKKGFILTNICDKIKNFSQLYWSLLRHLLIAAHWWLLRREDKGPVIKHFGILFYPKSWPWKCQTHSVLWTELKFQYWFKTLLLLLFNPAISVLILARAVEDVMDVFNTANSGYAFCPPHPGMDKSRVLAVTDGSFSCSL